MNAVISLAMFDFVTRGIILKLCLKISDYSDNTIIYVKVDLCLSCDLSCIAIDFVQVLYKLGNFV